MHVLVTGGAGFIGSHTVERLLELGATVRVLDNFTSGKSANLRGHERLEVVAGDIRDLPAVEQALDGISHLLHLAAQVSVTASVTDSIGSGQTNVAGFLNVLDSARRRKVQRFVYASSSAVYGIAPSSACTETTTPEPVSPYGLEKLINDLYAATYARLYGISSLGLRYFNVYGPRQDASSPYSGVISLFMRCLRQREPLTIFGDGGQTRDFIDVADVADVNAQALDCTIDGVCNVGTGHAVSLLELVHLMSETVGRAAQIRLLPERTGDIRHSNADNTRLRAAFNISNFTSVAAGLERLWRANQSHH